MVSKEFFQEVRRIVLSHYIKGIRFVEALMRRYGFGRLRLLERYYGVNQFEDLSFVYLVD